MRVRSSGGGVLTTILVGMAMIGVSAPAFAIEDGIRANAQWAVRFIPTAGGSCSGVALAAQWVATAKHCPGFGTISYPPIDVLAGGPGTSVQVTERYEIEGADIALLRTSAPVNLLQYPALSDIDPPAGTIGIAYGYGQSVARTGDYYQKFLRVVLGGQTLASKWGDVRLTLPEETDQPPVGRMTPGDSGGPLLVDGKVIGIASQTFPAKARENYFEYYSFAGVSGLISKILELAPHKRDPRGVSIDTDAEGINNVSVINNHVAVRMSSALLHSGKKVVFWVNGVYVGNVQNDISYYCSKSNFIGGSVVTPEQAVKDGDLVQISVYNGGSWAPNKADLLFARRLNGIQSVKLVNGSAEITLSSTLMHSGKRVVIWVNGAYVGEVLNDRPYYMYRREIAGATVLSTGVNAGNIVEIGIRPGGPGDNPGTPSDASELLYQNKL